LGHQTNRKSAATHNQQRFNQAPYFHKHLNYVGRALKIFRAYRLGQRRGAPVVARAGACLVPAPATAVEVVHPFASPSLLLVLFALLLLLLLLLFLRLRL